MKLFASSIGQRLLPCSLCHNLRREKGTGGHTPSLIPYSIEVEIDEDPRLSSSYNQQPDVLKFYFSCRRCNMLPKHA